MRGRRRPRGGGAAAAAAAPSRRRPPAPVLAPPSALITSSVVLYWLPATFKGSLSVKAVYTPRAHSHTLAMNTASGITPTTAPSSPRSVAAAAGLATSAAAVRGENRMDSAMPGCCRSSVTHAMPTEGVEEGELVGVVVGVAVRVAVAEAEGEAVAEVEAEAVRDLERVVEAEAAAVCVACALPLLSHPVPEAEPVRERVRVEEAESTAVALPEPVARALPVAGGVTEPPAPSPPAFAAPWEVDTVVVAVAEEDTVSVS